MHGLRLTDGALEGAHQRTHGVKTLVHVFQLHTPRRDCAALLSITCCDYILRIQYFAEPRRTRQAAVSQTSGFVDRSFDLRPKVS